MNKNSDVLDKIVNKNDDVLDKIVNKNSDVLDKIVNKNNDVLDKIVNKNSDVLDKIVNKNSDVLDKIVNKKPSVLNVKEKTTARDSITTVSQPFGQRWSRSSYNRYIAVLRPVSFVRLSFRETKTHNKGKTCLFFEGNENNLERIRYGKKKQIKTNK